MLLRLYKNMIVCHFKAEGKSTLSKRISVSLECGLQEQGQSRDEELLSCIDFIYVWRKQLCGNKSTLLVSVAVGAALMSPEGYVSEESWEGLDSLTSQNVTAASG